MNMHFGVVVPSQGKWGDPRRILAAVQATEDLGYDSVWFGDHVVIPS
jgi:alkanesulfonate monooxygenase SsuD/methylene tetrahydromethanopterin reductase-like flavin-dependent oxidoreductase (luciferase family)